jgi:hypothetical protein
MNEAITVQLIHTLEQLQVKVLDQVTRQILIHLNQLVQLAKLRKIHHIITDWVLTLQYTIFIRT